MKVYTSYYKKIESNPRGLLLVRISTSVPRWFSWHTEELSELYPGWDLVNAIKNGDITEEEYTIRYKEKLLTVDRQSIIDKLEKLSKDNGGKDIVLLCYEGSEDFCHRYVCGEWLDIGVTELA